jgi:hypothetical protein
MPTSAAKKLTQTQNDHPDSAVKKVAISETDKRNVYTYDSEDEDMEDMDKEVDWWKDECHRLRVAVKVLCVCVCVYAAICVYVCVCMYV